MCAIVVALCSIITNACSSQEETTSGSTSVRISLGGVSDEETTKSAETTVTQDFDLGNGTTLSSSIKQDKTTSTRTATALVDGVTYRVIVYKNSISTNNWVASKQFTVGNATDNVFSFDSGGNYIFVCYSFNNTEDLTFDGSSGTLLSNVSGTKDLLYKQVSINIADGTGTSTNTLSIVFNHEFSRIKVAFVSEIGNITALSGLKLSPNYASANLEMSNNTLTYNGTSSTGNFSIPTTLNSDATTTDYSIFCLPSATATLSIDNITAGTHSKNNTTNTYTIEPGKSYTITLTLKQAGITWSSGNLIYNSSTGMYSFTTPDGYGNYWFPNYTKPKIIDNTSHVNQVLNLSINGPTGDPCALVAPAGTWRLPTPTEYDSFISATVSGTGVNIYRPNRLVQPYYGTTGNTGIFFGTQTDPGTNRTNYLFFPSAGSYNTDDRGDEIGSAGIYITATTSAFYAYGFRGIWGISGPTILDSSATSANSNAYSIRCVK